jgi:hypothetical protein
MFRNVSWILFACLCFPVARAPLYAQGALEPCPRPAEGSLVTEPEDLRSHNGELKVELTARNSRQSDGSTRYCFLDEKGRESPTLRVSPGDLVILTLKNDLTDFHAAAAENAGQHMHAEMEGSGNSCTSGLMTSLSINLHFHGLTIPPVCHQDDVLKTAIRPGDLPFEYRFRIPEDEPPGLYWYHPHIHGFTKAQVLGGASGALIVEGIERADKAVAGLPERVLIIRDQDLLNPNAPPAKWEPVVPKMLIDRDGDAANNGTGYGKPAKDLSINFVPVPYPDYRPAVIEMKPEEQQLWRVLNASGITYLNLQLLYGQTPQPLGLVAMDGVPLNQNGLARDFVDWQTHLGIPPGARMEFIVKGPPSGVSGLLVTKTVDTGPSGENDPNRAIATVVASKDAVEPSPAFGGIFTASAATVAMARQCCSSADAKIVFLRKARRSQRSHERHRVLSHRRWPDATDVRSQIRRPQHSCQAGNSRRLDHRKPLCRTSCLPHSSAAFPAARLSGQAGE